MDTNPYAPPQAPLVEIPETAPETPPPYFAVSVPKLFTLLACTLGLYQLYWFYRNWKIIRTREQTTIKPALRALFPVFFCHALFAHVRQTGQRSNLTPPLRAGLLTLGWIVGALAQNLPDPYWLLMFPGFAPLCIVQSHINRINTAESPLHAPNAHFTLWNWIVVGLGGSATLAIAVMAVVDAAK